MQTGESLTLLITEYVQISHNLEKDLVIIDWQKPVTLDEFKTAYSLVFEYTRLKSVNKFVVDIQKKGFATPEEEEWWNTHFAIHLGNVDFDIFVSIVVNENQFRNLIQQYSLHWNNQFQKDDEHMHVNYLTSRADAMDWVLKKNAVKIDLPEIQST